MDGDTISTLDPSGPAAEAAAPSVSAPKSIVGVFTNPRKTFEAMASKPRFVVPLLLVILAQAAFGVVVYRAGIVKSDTIAKLEAQGKGPEVTEAVEKFFDSPAAPVIGAVSGAVITTFLLLFNAAVLFFFGNLMMGARLRFPHYLCATTFSAVVGLVDLFVRAGLALGRGTLDVRLGLGNVFGDDPGFLGWFLDTLTDPLMVWSAVVSAVGVSVFARKELRFGLLVALPAFLIRCLVFGALR